MLVCAIKINIRIFTSLRQSSEVQMCDSSNKSPGELFSLEILLPHLIKWYLTSANLRTFKADESMKQIQRLYINSTFYGNHCLNLYVKKFYTTTLEILKFISMISGIVNGDIKCKWNILFRLCQKTISRTWSISIF